MKRILVLAILLSGISAYAQNYPFKGGEQLDFKLQLKVGMGIDLGACTFCLDDEGDNYHLNMKMKSNAVLGTLYRLDHVYDSRFTRSGLVPVLFHREAKEGSNYWVRSDYIFSNGGRTVKAKLEKSTREPVEATVGFSGEVRDLTSILYVIRTFDMKQMEKGGMRCSLLMDRNVVDVEIRVVGHEVKKISGLGKFNTTKIALRGKSRGNLDTCASEPFSDMSDAEDMIYVWLSDDECRAPLFFSASSSFGSLNGRCVSYKGLKYNLSSRVN